MPLFKGGDPTIYFHYRPISIFLSFSIYFFIVFFIYFYFYYVLASIWKKNVLDRLVTYFSKYSMLSNDQFSFRSNFSSVFVLHLLCETFTKPLTTKTIKFHYFAIWPKTDKISHNILIEKLSLCIWLAYKLLNSGKQSSVYEG